MLLTRNIPPSHASDLTACLQSVTFAIYTQIKCETLSPAS